MATNDLISGLPQLAASGLIPAGMVPRIAEPESELYRPGSSSPPEIEMRSARARIPFQLSAFLCSMKLNWHFTERLHTVKPSQNALYYDLIKTFAQKSGTPVVLNTSFNENEPIVDTPQQAVNCFVRTDMDVLCLGPFVTTKPGKEVKAR